MRRMTAKQLRYFGTKSQRAGLRRKTTVRRSDFMRKARRSYSRVSRVSRRVGRSGSNTNKTLMGAVAASLVDPMISNAVPMLGSPIVQAAGGYLISKKGGLFGTLGTGFMIIGALKLVSGVNLGGLTAGTSGSGYVN